MGDLGDLIPLAGIMVGALAILGWVFTEWMKIRHGYPLEDEDGNLIHRSSQPEDVEKIRELKAENADLRGRLESISDRVETLERIATDKPARLAAEIDALSDLSMPRKKEDAR